MKPRNLYRFLLLGAISAGIHPSPAEAAKTKTGRFVLASNDISPRSTIGNKFVLNSFGCTGENVSPELHWEGAPATTKSYALIVQDIDAQTGVGGFTHWMVTNIPASSRAIPTGAGTAKGELLPSGASQPASSVGAPGWAGPCPPAGDKAHRYQFTLYALKVDKLELPEQASQAFVGYNVVVNSIASTKFVAKYAH